MIFIGVDLHTNRFACCYRDGRLSDRPQDRVMKTFGLDEAGLAAFCAPLTADAYVLVEATITAFSFVRLFKDRVKEVVIGNACQLKRISPARNNTDKIDADKLCQALKAQALSGVRQIVPVALPPEKIQELRSLFGMYRLYRKQNTQLKNRIHSLLKERLYGFTREEIFDKQSRRKIRGISDKPMLSFQTNQLTGRLERDEGGAEALKERALAAAEPFMAEIDILTSMKGGVYSSRQRS
jgi:transposase